MADKEKINVALIGIGYWGPNILRNLVTNSNYMVKYVVDIDEDRLNKIGKLYPKLYFTNDLDSLYEDPDLDAIVIATPVKTHFDLAIRALENGKHVFVEKPMATKVSEIEKIEQISEDNNLVAMAGHTFLYNSAVRKIKEIIDSGEIGQIRYIYSQRLNLGRIRDDVNALWNLAPHDVSIIQYWLDDIEPIAISSHGMDYIQKGIEDVVFLNINYPDNIMANIHVSWLDPNKVRKMTLIGSKKMLVYDDLADNKVTIYDKGIDLDNNQFSYRIDKPTFPEIDWKEPLKVEIDHFLDCIINGVECITGPEHARKVVSILSSNSNGDIIND